MAPNRLNYINVGPRGTFRASGNTRTSPLDVDEILTEIERLQGVLLYLHGGLNSEAEGLAAAERMAERFAPSGLLPVTFVWETGVLETIHARVGEIERTRLLQRLVRVAVRRLTTVATGAGGRGGAAPQEAEQVIAGTMDSNELDSLERSVAEGAKSEGNLEAWARDAEVHAHRELSNPEIDQEVAELPAELARRMIPRRDDQGARGVTLMTIVKIIGNVLLRSAKRFAQGRDHGLHATVVEEFLREVHVAELAEWLWSGMKKTAEEMWYPNDGLAGDAMHPGRYFLEGLAKLRARRPDLVIDVCGHSAGSIAICHMLAASEALDLRMRRVAFLAPAATLTLFHQAVVTKPNRYDAFRMFTMRDELERADRLFGWAYPHSLLYLVAGVLEAEPDAPLAGMHRFFGPSPPVQSRAIDEVQRFLRESGRLVLSRTDPGVAVGLACGAAAHGAFDEDDLTAQSLLAYLAEA